MSAPPGRLLDSVAARVVDRATYERVLRPLIADLQFEHARAGSLSARTLVRLRGLCAFWLVLARIATLMAVVGPRADQAATRLLLLRFLSAASGLTGLLTAHYLWQCRNSPLVLPIGPCVLPAMLLAALPVAALLAGLRMPARPEHLRAAWRVGMVAGIATFVLAAWVVPLARQELVVRVVRAATENPSLASGRAEGSAPVSVDRGHAAMTLAQLSERAVHVRSWGRHLDEIPLLEAEWHKRPSLGVACLAFALLGCGLGATRCRGIWRGLTAVLGVAGFYAAIRETQHLADTGHVDPVLAMWGPVLVLCLCTLAVHGAARLRPAVPS